MNRFVFTRRRLTVASVVIAVAIAGEVWVTGYKTLTPLGQAWIYGSPPRMPQSALVRMQSEFFASPAWTAPVAALIAIAAIGTAVLLLRRPLAQRSPLPPV